MMKSFISLVIVLFLIVPFRNTLAQNNIALNKTTEQSSTLFEGSSSKLVDGNTDGNFLPSQTVNHTKYETNPWWQVDLGDQYDISKITLWNRTDQGYWMRSKNLYVMVSETLIIANSKDYNQFTEGNHAFITQEQQSLEIFGNKKGRYIRIFMDDINVFNLAEVEIFGTKANGDHSKTTTSPVQYGTNGRKQLSLAQTMGNIDLKLGQAVYYGKDGGSLKCVFKDSKNRIILGGNFHFEQNGQVIDNIAVWENNQWHPFKSASGNHMSLGQVVDIVEDSKQNIYVLSQQLDKNYNEENTVQKWDGTQWHILGIFNKGLVNELAISPSDELYVCGSFKSITINARKRSISGTAKYHNGTWYKVSNIGLNILDIAVNSKGELFALDGHGYVVKAARGKWKRLATKYIKYAYDLTFDAQDNLYVCGYFGLTQSTDSKGKSIVNNKDAQGNAIFYSNVAKFDGKHWSNLNGGNDNIYDLVITNGTDVYFSNSRKVVSKWDGQKITDIDLKAKYINDIIFDHQGHLISIGQFESTAESSSDKDKLAIWKWR